MFKFGDKSKEARCEYNCSKYCEIYDIDGMSKLEGKYVCAACYNCAKEELFCPTCGIELSKTKDTICIKPKEGEKEIDPIALEEERQTAEREIEK